MSTEYVLSQNGVVPGLDITPKLNTYQNSGQSIDIRASSSTSSSSSSSSVHSLPDFNGSNGANLISAHNFSSVSDTNLVTNGDFSAGNTGFSSDYTFYPGSIATWGGYSAGKNPTLSNSQWLSLGDHTTGTGNMLIVDGSTSSTSKVWSETITVTPNTTYNLSAWMANVDQDFTLKPANLQFTIDSQQLGSFTTSTTTNQWQQFSKTWNSGANTVAQISIVDLSTAGWGNDFALDDISFKATSPPTPNNSNDNAGLLWHNYQTGENVVWSMNGSTLSSYQDIFPVYDKNWKEVGTGDFKGDGQTEILWRNSATGEDVMWFMNGTTLSSYQDIKAIPDQNWNLVGTGDFNGDGKADILWRNSATGEDVVWFMNGTTLSSWQDLTAPPVTDTNWQIVGTGDFNKDGKIDIVWRNKATGEDVVWFMKGSTFSSWQDLNAPAITNSNWHIVGTGDFNGDGNTDLVWRNSQNNQNVIWFMNGINETSWEYISYQGNSVAPDQNWQVGSYVLQKQSVPITINNPGFENPSLSVSNYTLSSSTNPIPGWVTTGTELGVFHPSPSDFPSVTEGVNTAFMGGISSSTDRISQTLSAGLSPGTYTLKVDVGTRKIFDLFAGYTIELLAGTNIIAEDSNTVNPSPGSFLTSTAAVNVTSNNPYLGEPLTIVLSANPGYGHQTNFDNVRLTWEHF